MNDHTGIDLATLRSLNVDLDTRNFTSLRERADAYARRKGPQVGEFVELLDGTVRRFVEDWGGEMPTTRKEFTGDSFYLSIRGADYTGGWDDAPVLKAKLRVTDETRFGRFWFFRDNSCRTHNRVYVTFPCRVWRVQPDPATAQPVADLLQGESRA